jgi:hypothetical protein
MESECASCEVRTGLKVLLQVASISQLTVSRLSRQCGILNISQPYRSPRPVTGIALLFYSVSEADACTGGVLCSIKFRELPATGYLVYRLFIVVLSLFSFFIAVAVIAHIYVFVLFVFPVVYIWFRTDMS